MRLIDLLRMGVKNLHSKWIVMPIIGIAISMFCLSFAGAALQRVHGEKSLPYVFDIVSGVSDLTDVAMGDISKIPEVTAVTPVLEIPARIKINGKTIEMTLIGINSEFLTVDFVLGGAYPKTSIMPYIVMNEAAGAQLLDQQDDADLTDEADVPATDWTSKNAAISIGEGKWIVSKITGVLADDEPQEPSMYISIATAKDLLRNSGQSTDYIGANVRITNIGHADSVSKAISKLGLSVGNRSGELQNNWNVDMREITYIIVGGLFCLLSSMVFMMGWRKNTLLEQKESYATLRWMGMKKNEIGRLFVIQTMYASLFGIATGMVVCMSLPSFLSVELQGESIFALLIPFQAIFLSSVICLLPVVLISLTIKRSISNALDS